MKKLTITTLALLLLVIITATAQNLTQSVKGKVTDIDSQSPLPGAYVIIVGSDPLVGAVTDMDGNFRIDNIKIGRLSLKISFIGYEDVFANELMLTTGTELVVNFKMLESINKLEEIVIKPENLTDEPINDMSVVSAKRITVESTSRIAAGLNDPGRTVQSYAGVSIGDDENNEIVVRGNSPRGVLWRMEGIEIPNPNHFSNGEGGSGGGVSALSTQVLDDSDFFTGAFSAEYGNALSSVFDLRLRNGNFDRQQYALQIGVLGLQASLEGPFKRGSEASYLVNYRYSTTSLLNNMGFEIGDSDVFPAWQDLSFNINLPTKKMGRVNIWGLGGVSSAADIAESDTSKWEYRGDAYNASENHKLGIVGATHNYLFNNNKTYLKTVASYSYSGYLDEEDSLSNDLVKSTTREEDYNYNTISVSSFINHKFDAKNTLRLGAIYTNQEFALNAKIFNYDLQVLETQIAQTGSINKMQSYFQWKYRVNQSLDINTGVHYTYLPLNNDYTFEPRLGLKWKFRYDQNISFGLGLHSRAEAASIYKAQQFQPDGSAVLPNEDLQLTKAFHSVLGYGWNFAESFNFKAEVYYQYLYDVPVIVGDTTGIGSSLNFSSGFTNTDLENTGTGKNYGVELTLEKNFSKGYYLLATASLFDSKYTMPDGIERNTIFNSKYIYNLVGGNELKVGRKKQNILGANIRMILRGGNRSVPVDFAASEAEGKDVRDYSRAFETKMPDYFRIDVGVSYRKNLPKWSWVLSVDIQNVTGNLNVYGEYYQAETNTLEPVYMVGLLPVINYKVEF